MTNPDKLAKLQMSSAYGRVTQLHPDTLVRDHLAALQALVQVRRAMSALSYKMGPMAVRAKRPDARGLVAARWMKRAHQRLAQLRAHEQHLAQKVAA